MFTKNSKQRVSRFDGKLTIGTENVVEARRQAWRSSSAEAAHAHIRFGIFRPTVDIRSINGVLCRMNNIVGHV